MSAENPENVSGGSENSLVPAGNNRPVAMDPNTPKSSGSRKRKTGDCGINLKAPSKVSIIRTYTEELSVNGEYIFRCALVDDCQYSQKIFRQSNFERHFQLCHPAAYDQLCIGPPTGKCTSPNTEPALTIRMTVHRLLGGIVKLVTIHGLPFAAVEWEGFQDVVEPMLSAYKLTINRHNITQYVTAAANGINWLITEELRGKTISLKLDIVSKMYRSMLGINCQYVNNNGDTIKRNLGIIELHNKHSGQNLKEEVFKVLSFFGVGARQIITITIDNASNMVKLVKLLSAEAASEADLNAGTHVEYCTDVAIEDAASCSKGEPDTYELLDSDSPEKPAVQEWARVLEELAPEEFITAIRCGAHTTQLVVHDVCKDVEHKDTLKEIRSKVKKFRSTEYKTFFEVSEGSSYPPLPNDTRWNSDYKMQKELKKGREFFEKLGKQYSALDLSNCWDFIEEYVTAFEALYDCTIACQRLDLTLSDFYLEWVRANARICELEDSNRFKKQILLSMERRQQKLFCNRIFKSALYFDPRVNFNGSTLFSPAQKEDIVQFCLQIWDRIRPNQNKQNRSDENDQNTANTSNASKSEAPTCSKFSLNQYLSRTIGAGAPQTVQMSSLEARIRSVQYQQRIDADIPFKVVKYWAARRFEDPQLWMIAQVIYAIPPTQCSIERDFNLFNSILTKSRGNLSSKSLQDVLKVRTNSSLVKKGLAYMFSKDKTTLEELRASSSDTQDQVQQ